MSGAPLGPRELARRTGVSTDTLRHYERKGLLASVPRSGSGYRRYPTDAVARVLVIQRALVVAFSLRDLARILAERDRGGAPCRAVLDLMGARLEDLDRRIEELVAIRAELKTLVADWRRRLSRTPPGRRAHLLETLGDQPAIDRARGRRARQPPPRRRS